MPWVALTVWIVVLLGVDIASRRLGFGREQVPYLLATAVASLGLVTLIAFARLAGSPPELRTLRIVAVLLPSAFVLLIELALYFIEVDERVTEVGEHVFAVAILSAGAVPFSVYIFRAFTRLRDELAQRAQRLEALHEASTSMTGEASLHRLHVLIVDGARRVVEADRAVLRLGGEQGGPETILTSPRAGCEVEDSDVRLLDSVSADGKPGRGYEGENVRSLGVPVRRSGRPIGAIVVSRTAGPEFTLENEFLLEMFAVAASSGIDNALRLEEAQFLATAEERERIARDLHDDLGQLLGFLTAKIQAAQELSMKGRDAEAREEMAGLERATRTLSAQVRDAILGLRARVGPDRPIGRALEEYVADFGIQAGLLTRFEGDPEAGRNLPGPAQYQLLRIAQEALSNSRRHAHAQRVVVMFQDCPESLELSISDDGSGFVRNEGEAGFGLKTMAERARALNAEFDLQSQPHVGTVVTVRVPLPVVMR